MLMGSMKGGVGEPARVRRDLWFLWGGIILVYILLRINLLDIPLDRDEGLFGYVGSRILEGEIPYRDLPDHKPPLPFYLYALALLVVPRTPSGIHLFLHAYNLLTLVAVFLVSRRLGRSDAEGLWSAFCYAVISSSPMLQGFTASTEMLMILPLTLSLLAALIAGEKRSLIWYGISGFLGALACWSRQTALFPVAFVLLFVTVDLVRSWKRVGSGGVTGGVVAPLAAWFAGVIVPSVTIVGYFAAVGSLGEFWYWVFTHGSLYAAKGEGAEKVPYILKMLTRIVAGNPFPIVIGIAVTAASLFRKEGRGLFLAGFLAFSLAGTIPGFAYKHYFAQLLPALALICGFGIESFLSWMRRGGARRALTVASVILVLAVPLFSYGDYYRGSPNRFARKTFDLNPFPESLELARYLARRTTPADRIYIIGSEPQILFYAGRQSATSFAMFYPLMTDFPRAPEFRVKLFGELLRSPPRYILYVDNPVSLSADLHYDLPFLDNNVRFIQSGYELEAVMQVGGEKGALVETKDGKAPPSSPDTPLIYIHRRKGT